MDQYFDRIYYALAVIILLALGYSAYTGFRRSTASTIEIRIQGMGIALAAIGTAIALVGGLLADSFLKTNSLFQQTRFFTYYVGFFLITFGLNQISRAAQKASASPGEGRSQQDLTSLIFWFFFFVPLAISVFFLVNPQTFTINQFGVQVQKTIYWLPMLTTTLVGALLLAVFAFTLQNKNRRALLFWSGAFSIFVFIGLLRESLILPDLGDPLANLLIAFVPFVIASVCLCLGARKLTHILP